MLPRWPGGENKSEAEKTVLSKNKRYDVTLWLLSINKLQGGGSVTSLLEIENPRWQIGLVPQNPVTAKKSFVTGPFFAARGSKNELFLPKVSKMSAPHRGWSNIHDMLVIQ